MSRGAGRGRTPAIAAAVAALAIGATAALGRWADGPVGPLPGGRFASGRTVAGAPDLAALAAREVVELELDAGGRSILVGVVVRDRGIYLPATLAPLKRWHRRVAAGGAVRVRVGDEIFGGRLERVADAGLRRALFADAQRKYGGGLYFGDRVEGATEFFRFRWARE